MAGRSLGVRRLPAWGLCLVGVRFLGGDGYLVPAAEFVFHRDYALQGPAGQVPKDGSHDQPEMDLRPGTSVKPESGGKYRLEPKLPEHAISNAVKECMPFTRRWRSTGQAGSLES